MEHIGFADADQGITRVGLGGCPLGGHGWGRVDDAEARAAVRRALDLGINFFDTADVYGLGHSEELLAETLADRRRDVILASKFGVRWDASGRTWKDISPGYVRHALEASLRRLRLDCIPLYYVHWPDGVTPIEETMAELERVRQEGKIRWIGLSNFSPPEVRRALSAARVHALQIQFSLVDRLHAADVLPFVQAENITLICWGCLAQGLLTGKYNEGAIFEAGDRRNRYENFRGGKFKSNLRMVQTLREIAGRVGKTPGQVAIRWLLDTPGVGCVLFGAKRSAQVEENSGAAGWQLSPDDYEMLGQQQSSGDPCDLAVPVSGHAA